MDFMVGMRPEEMVGPPLAGSKLFKCGQCARDVWLTIASRMLVRMRSLPIVCPECACAIVEAHDKLTGKGGST